MSCQYVYLYQYRILAGVFYLEVNNVGMCNLLLLYRKLCLYESQRKTLWLSSVNPRKGFSK